ncbi:unnamed protein product [Strongylus vulgaris]|uniref:Uncharacterized protein n=1 Tax=Strongylus vulgaris TaxID=40348 RepID=A0A3P7JNY9_STRVU|nr:unnamed protein product [Strongylus vulgaris]
MNSGRSAYETPYPAPPSKAPTKDARIEIVVPMTTSFTYSEVGKEFRTAIRPTTAEPSTDQKTPSQPGYVPPNVEPRGPIPPANHADVAEQPISPYAAEGKIFDGYFLTDKNYQAIRKVLG